MTEFRRASTLEGIQFTAVVGVPSVVQGLFKKRELPTRLAARAGAERMGHGLVASLAKKYGPDPFFVRVATDDALLVTSPADLEFVLGGSPDPFASDPPAKKAGMSAFQPDALTLSRGDVWQTRRAFAEAVLESGSRHHTLAAPFLAHADELVAGLGTSFDWEQLNAAFQRLTRQVVLGPQAADDDALTALLGDLMAEGNKTPGEPGERYPELLDQLRAHLDHAAPGSLASMVGPAAAPGGIDPATQVIHWLFAMGDTLPANVARALALLATHPDQARAARGSVDEADLSSPLDVAELQYVGGALAEAMRLFPTTGLFGRVATQDVTFPNGAVLPEGTQVLIHNGFNHRDRARFAYADRFAPEEWVSGDAGDQWSFNFMSHGPQGCPGFMLSFFLGQAVIAGLLARGAVSVSGVSLDPRKALPYTIDLYPLEFGTTR